MLSILRSGAKSLGAASKGGMTAGVSLHATVWLQCLLLDRVKLSFALQAPGRVLY